MGEEERGALGRGGESCRGAAGMEPWSCISHPVQPARPVHRLRLEGPCAPAPALNSCSFPPSSWALPAAAPVCQGREPPVPSALLVPSPCLALDAPGGAERALLVTGEDWEHRGEQEVVASQRWDLLGQEHLETCTGPAGSHFCCLLLWLSTISH